MEIRRQILKPKDGKEHGQHRENRALRGKFCSWGSRTQSICPHQELNVIVSVVVLLVKKN